MRHVEQQPDDRRIGGRQDLRHLLGAFAQVAHVIVVDQLDPVGLGPLAELRQQAAHPLAVFGRRLAIRGPLVGDLHVQAAGGPDEPGVLLVQGERLGLAFRAEQHVAARKADEFDLVLREHRLQRRPASRRTRGRTLARQLDAVEAGFGDLGDAAA